MSTGLAALPARPALAAAGINKQINFQGKVTNTNGTNVANGSYSFTFKLYNVASAGTAIWTETKSLTVTDGVFQTNLGSVTSLPGSVDFNTDGIYLGMAFNGDPEMSPRIQFTAAAYAFNSDKLQGLGAADFAQINPASAQSGSLNVTGSVQAATSLQAPLVDTATAVALNIGTGTATSVTIGRATTPFLVQGNSASSFTATSGANTTTVGFTAPTGNNSILFPDAGGTICTTVASTCSATYAASANLLAKNAADTSTFAVTAANYLYGFTNSSAATASGVLKLDNGSNTGSALTVVGSGNPAAGQALLLVNAAAGVTGSLIDLQVNASSVFAVNQAGAVTTGSTINGQTITSAASFTGTVTAATSLLAPLLDTASAGALNIGTTNATSINLKKDTLTSGRSTITPGTDVLATPQLRVTTSTGNNAFTVGTSAQYTQVGVNLGSTNTPGLSGNGVEIQGALRLTGGGGTGSTFTDNFTTPVGSTVGTKINIPLYDPGSFAQIIAMGLPSTANANSRALSLFDARTVAHQPTIGVFAPDENNLIGFSWDGDNTNGLVKNTANIITLQAGGLNVLKASNSSSNAVVELGTNGLLKTTSVDTVAAATLNLGTSTATGVTVGKSGVALSAPGGVTTSNANINAGTGTITSGAINGQTISSAASFTGTVTAATSFIAALHVTADVASGTSGGITLRSGNATAGNGSSGNVTVDVGAKNGTGFAGNINIGATNALNVNIGHNAATASGTTISLQGLAATSQIIMNDATNANKTTVSFATPTAARSIVFPDAGGTICTTVASTCSGTYMTSGSYLTKNAADTSSASVAGNLYGFTNTNTGAAGVLALTNAGTNAALSVTSSANAAANQAVILATNSNATPTGNLIDLRVSSGSRFSVDTAGAVTTSSTINGQTISSSASFTGTVTSATGISVTSGGIAVGGNSSITGTLGVSNTLTVSAGGASVSGGLNNNSGGITGAGAISGATTIVASSDIQGGGVFKTADTAAASTASAAVTLKSGDASGTGGASGSGAVSIDSGTSTNGTTGAISVGTVNASAVTIGRAGAPTTVQGNSSLAIQANNGTNYTAIQFTAPTAQVAYTLGTNATNTSATICTSLAASCNTVYQPYVASGYLLKSPTSNVASSSNFAGYQYAFTQSNGASAGNLSLVNAGTSSALLVTQSSNPSAGQALVTINNSNATPSGNVLDIQKGGTSQFAVDYAGNVNTLAGASSGKINGQTISSTASFTGTVTSASGISVTSGGITVGGNSSVTGSLGVSNTLTVSAGGASISGGINNNAGGITAAGAVSGLSSLTFNTNGTIDTASSNSISIGTSVANAVTIGRAGAALSLQGSASTSLAVSSGTNNTTVNFVTPTAGGIVYQFGNATTGTYQICTSYASSCGTTYMPYSSTTYLQLNPASAQTDATTTPSIWVNKSVVNTSNLLKLQAANSDVFSVQANGNLTSTGVASLAGGVMTVDTATFKVKIGSGTPTLGNGTSGALFVSNGAEFASIVKIGDNTNNASFDGTTKEVTFSGTARHARTIRLVPEFAGAVLDTGGQTSITGTMTASLDSSVTPSVSYYKWTTSQSTTQTYDVVVTVPIPEDWGAWNGAATIVNYGSGTGVAETVTAYDGTGAVDTGVNGTALTMAAAWNTRTLGSFAGSYSAGGTMKLRIRMAAGSAGDTRLGTITLPYLSKW